MRASSTEIARLWSVFVSTSPRELDALVLYPDGSGGIARDLPAGRTPPARTEPSWHDAATALEVLAPGRPAEDGSPVEQLVRRWLRARATAAALRRERGTLRCSGGARPTSPASCWKRSAETVCDGCARARSITDELHRIRAGAGTVVRELRKLTAA